MQTEKIKNLALRIKKANRVYLVGNGGSWANSVHICNDLLSVGIKAYTLDPATLTAFANDHGYRSIFARWIDVVGEPGDLLIALSGSGTSANIEEAIAIATIKGMQTELITDYLRTMDMQRSEEMQLEIGHELMRNLKCV